MKPLRKVLLLVGFSLLTACGGLDIYNAKNVDISTAKVGMKAIEKAVITAGTNRGWIMRKVEKGKVKGTLHVRNKHMAEVLVTYNEKNFNIDYAGSKNLKYDPQERTIHRNYNSWGKNLENDILILLNIQKPSDTKSSN